MSPTTLRPLRFLDVLLVLATLIAGFARGSGLPMTSDAGYHLVTVGQQLVAMSLEGYATPPGGTLAPPLGALLTGVGALFSENPEFRIQVGGAAMLGLAAALVALTLIRTTGRIGAIVGASFVLLPPYFASAFTYRPDAALGGALLAAAFGLRGAGQPTSVAALPAWIATLTTPWAWPVAITLAVRDRPGGDWARRLLAPAAIVTAIVLLMQSLPSEARGEMLVALFGEVGWPPDGLLSTAPAFRGPWVFGTLLAIAGVLTFRNLDPTLRLAWWAMVGSALLFGTPGAFFGATAVFVPATALILAWKVAEIPDPHVPEGAPPRPLMLAVVFPLLLLVAGSGANRTDRDAVRRQTAGDTQVALALSERLQLNRPVAAERSGTLRALATEATWPLREPVDLAAFDDAGVSAIRLGRAYAPESPAGRAHFRDPGFWRRYAPWEFSVPTAAREVLWLRRAIEVESAVPAEYAEELAKAFELRRRDPARAAEHFRAAAALEPDELGIAHEHWGLWLERQREREAATAAFARARRDRYAVRARGHLADRHLSRGELAPADSLISEAFAVAPFLGELRGTRSRLFLMAGYVERAQPESESAVQLAPTDPRLLVNHGTLLWAMGDPQTARGFWRRAQQLDPGVATFLGRFETAPDSAEAPPLMPLFSRVGFLDSAFSPAEAAADADAPAADFPAEADPAEAPASGPGG